jgi:hypothetical protein
MILQQCTFLMVVHGLQEELDTNAVDLCQWFIPCVYEEQIDKTPLPKRWYSQDPGR